MNLGQTIKTLRKEQNITQDELANALNITSQSISKWEKGLANPDVSYIPIIAKFFGVSIETLFIWEDGNLNGEYNESLEIQNKLKVTDDIDSIIELWEDLHFKYPNDFRILKELIVSMCSKNDRRFFNPIFKYSIEALKRNQNPTIENEIIEALKSFMLNKCDNENSNHNKTDNNSKKLTQSEIDTLFMGTFKPIEPVFIETFKPIEPVIMSHETLEILENLEIPEIQKHHHQQMQQIKEQQQQFIEHHQQQVQQMEEQYHKQIQQMQDQQYYHQVQQMEEQYHKQTQQMQDQQYHHQVQQHHHQIPPIQPFTFQTKKAKGKKVLIVDDANFMRHMLREILTKANYEVIGEAVNGYEAIEATDSLNPDIIIMDITMPEMDGIAATEKILAKNPDIIVIMCSAMGYHNLVLETIKLGVSYFVAKPFQLETLTDALARLF